VLVGDCGVVGGGVEKGLKMTACAPESVSLSYHTCSSLKIRSGGFMCYSLFVPKILSHTFCVLGEGVL
jgi:hypothetical protein